MAVPVGCSVFQLFDTLAQSPRTRASHPYSVLGRCVQAPSRGPRRDPLGRCQSAGCQVVCARSGRESLFVAVVCARATEPPAPPGLPGSHDPQPRRCLGVRALAAVGACWHPAGRARPASRRNCGPSCVRALVDQASLQDHLSRLVPSQVQSKPILSHARASWCSVCHHRATSSCTAVHAHPPHAPRLTMQTGGPSGSQVHFARTSATLDHPAFCSSSLS